MIGAVHHSSHLARYSIVRTIFYQLSHHPQVSLKAGVEISHMTPSGLVFVDGTRVTADLIVFATGFECRINLMLLCSRPNIQIQVHHNP